jgi:pyroglutamyl-peptidase
MRILITGFGPFDSVVDNPSGRLAEHLGQEGLPGHELITEVLPVSFKQAGERIEALLRGGDFDLVLLLGVAGKEVAVRLEQYGRNLDQARIPDCDGAQPQGLPVRAGGPEVYACGIALDPLREALDGAGLRASLSESAGGYVCNHLYYIALHTLAEEACHTRCLFVHVPPDEHTFGEVNTEAYMPFAEQVRAVRMILERLTAPLGQTVSS